MKVLLVVLLVITAAAALPCPDNNVIYPCICSTETINSRIHLNLDCSDVPSNSVLQSVFQASFPFNKFSNLTINPKISHPALNVLDSYVFGDVSFEHVIIDNTYIHTINEEAFSASHDTLISLVLTNNRIDVFPFETMSSFLHLRILNLANNKLSSLPNLISQSLLVLDLSFNVGLKFSENTLREAPQLEELHLHNMGFTYFPPNVFSSLKFLNIIDLSKNSLKGKLEQGIVRVPLDSVKDLRLNNNHIDGIEATAITGVHRTATIDFSNNNIVSLDWDHWYPLLDQLTGVQTVDLTGNSLQCSCDLVWLLLDKDELDKIGDYATCADGTFMKNTDVNDLLVLC